MVADSSSDKGESHNENRVSRDGKRGWKTALGKPRETGKCKCEGTGRAGRVNAQVTKGRADPYRREPGRSHSPLAQVCCCILLKTHYESPRGVTAFNKVFHD
jgi:hypothetical protein